MRSRSTRKSVLLGTTLLAAVSFSGSLLAQELRLITWGGYAPDDVVAQFEKETGIDVKVTLSNNEDMISKLRATGGAGFDLAQPSQDRIVGVQRQFNIYKPIDYSRVNTDQLQPSMVKATQEATELNGQYYGVPAVWGTSGLVVHSSVADVVKDYTDLCDPAVAGQVSYRLKRPTLIGFAFAMGMDPFAAYGDPDKYADILDKVEDTLIDCKANVKTYWTGGDQLLALLRTGEVKAAMAWDAGGWKLNAENPEIRFVAPESGALGWIDTFAIPRRAENEDAAYQWINFVMRPEIAARITNAAGNFTASKGAEAYVKAELRDAYRASFNDEAINNIKWYPPVPPGLETMEGQVLDRVQAAN
ncbi:extracellular solute-binding protein [Marinobacter lutaoensis]|uniref:Spermidine/putrescine ABC transporter substrate-binding protein n=1 Tax=Marinobacter lutaoensis TaxID=135739 RepID=A0A1V2DWM5_9GAMM|nr:extracellular solute-binding protein [Marinobacter lutaoensis]MBI41928.1 spermidine/putrescine ABC transporter substrate-binding protein [Oceanospirillales bacterium]NVD36515.1 extracellular solute-binding protein [Marinobacter lutaoensis]ONF44860.1 spermidine/putrescine ABC transporter substrate-binding protein [Marinobacter lutaoensis]